MTLEERVEKLEKENKEMKSTIEQLETSFSSTNCSLASLEANVCDAKSQIRELKMTTISYS